MSLDAAEGEILGEGTEEGVYPVTVHLEDSSNPPLSASTTSYIAVQKRVTENWFETGNRIGGLRHGRYDVVADDVGLADTASADGIIRVRISPRTGRSSNSQCVVRNSASANPCHAAAMTCTAQQIHQ